MVNNQESALRFYTTILGFVKNKDIPMGPFRWLTVSSPEGRKVSSSCWSLWVLRLLRRIKQHCLPPAFQPLLS